VKDVLDDASHSIVTIGVGASNSYKFLELLFQLADMYEIKASDAERKETAEGGPKEKTVSVYIAGGLQNVSVCSRTSVSISRFARSAPPISCARGIWRTRA